MGKIYRRHYEKSGPGVSTRRVPVIIALEQNGQPAPGYEVAGRYRDVRKEKPCCFPRNGTADAAGSTRMWQWSQGSIRERIIQVGEKNQQWVEVLEGVKAGETVVRDGSRELKEGTRVKAKQ